MNVVAMVNSWELSEDAAKLLLRLVIGVTVLLHGIHKLTTPESVGFIGGAFESFGLPAFLAYLVYLGEVIAPVMLLLGWQTKIGALLVAITIVVAVVLVHLGDIFTLTAYGGWGIELQALMLFTAIAIFGLGAGKYSLDAKRSQETVTIP